MSCNSATAPVQCTKALKEKNIIFRLCTTIRFKFIARVSRKITHLFNTKRICPSEFYPDTLVVHVIPSHLQSTSSSFWSRKSCWRKWCGKSSESFLNSCRPKSVSFSTHLESTRQLEVFKLPWYLNGDSCKYNMPCVIILILNKYIFFSSPSCNVNDFLQLFQLWYYS